MNSIRDNDRRVVRADPRARRSALVWTLIAVVVGLAVYLCLADVAAELDALAIDAPELAVERAAHVLEISLGTAAALALIAAAWLARLATRILEAGCYPTPGARLTRDTPLRSGAAARRIAWLAFTCAGVLAAAAIGLLVIGWQLIATMTPDSAALG